MTYGEVEEGATDHGREVDEGVPGRPTVWLSEPEAPRVEGPSDRVQWAEIRKRIPQKGC